MDSNVPNKMLGLFKAFKACTEKIQQTKNQLKSSEEQKGSSTNCIHVIKRTGDVAVFDAEKIAIAIGRAFLAIEGQNTTNSNSIEELTRIVLNTFNHSPNYDLYCYASYATQKGETISSKLEDKIASCIPPLFKKFKTITSTIIFITTRNFSIQKNLSISA